MPPILSTAARQPLFVIYQSGPYPLASRSPWVPRSVVQALSRHLEHPRNPRREEYMLEVARRAYPDFEAGRVVRIPEDQRLPAIDWSTVSEVVLLWSDANGLGWRGIEAQLFRQAPAGSRISVVNGRRRQFVLRPELWRRILRRRFIEKSLIPELAFTMAFIVTTPWLVAWDLARGRR